MMGIGLVDISSISLSPFPVNPNPLDAPKTRWGHGWPWPRKAVQNLQYSVVMSGATWYYKVPKFFGDVWAKPVGNQRPIHFQPAMQASVKAVSQRSKRGSKSWNRGSAVVSITLSINHSEITLALNPLAFKYHPYVVSRTNVFTEKRFWEQGSFILLFQSTKSSNILFTGSV